MSKRGPANEMSDIEERIERITRDLANRHHQEGLEVDLGHALDLDLMLVQVQKTIKGNIRRTTK